MRAFKIAALLVVAVVVGNFAKAIGVTAGIGIAVAIVAAGYESGYMD